jgi:hypothetical protein
MGLVEGPMGIHARLPYHVVQLMAFVGQRMNTV